MLGKAEVELTLFILVAMFGAMSYLKLLPSVDSLKETAEVLNTKGGNILMLCLLSMVFFFMGFRFIYWSANMIIDGKLTADNAVTLTGINWITGTAFGGAFGALLKTMTGDSPGSGTTTTTSSSVTAPVVNSEQK